MALAGYDHARFTEVRDAVGGVLSSLGYVPDRIPFIPVSASEGDNVPASSCRMPWYKGKALLPTMEERVRPPRSYERASLRMPVQDIYRTPEPLLVGRLESGTVRPGDEIIVQPQNIRASVAALRGISGPCPEARAGECVDMVLRDIDTGCIARGSVCAGAASPCACARSLRAQVVTLDPGPAAGAPSFRFHCGTGSVLCAVSGYDEKQLCCTVQITLASPLPLDRYADLPALGRFLLTANGAPLAAGVVTDILETGAL
jgi:translation elongation factor EF-1alpha